MKYLKSLFSLKKIVYKDISWFALWDKESDFTKHTRLGHLVRLSSSKIGRYTRINSGCSFLKVTVGNFSSLAGNSQFGAGRHPLHFASTSQIFYNENSLNNQWVKPIPFTENLPIHIGNDVWIGTQCLVMGGVTIGDGAVIGSRSVVTKDIPPYAIAVGTPAKVINHRFSQDVIERLLEIQWWKFSDEQITEHIDFFRDPELTLDKLNAYFPVS